MASAEYVDIKEKRVTIHKGILFCRKFNKTV